MENQTRELSKYRMDQARQCITSAKALVEIDDYKGAAFLPLVGLTVEEAQKAFETIDKQREKLVNPTSTQKALGKLGGLFKK